MEPPRPWPAIVGPTASGKTGLALAVARRLRDGGGRPVEIVSCDSMLVYRGMDIGTAKPSLEQRTGIPHHLVDLTEPSAAYSVAEFQAAAAQALGAIAAADARPLIVGGSGLYFRAIVDRLSFPGTDAATRADLEAEAAAVGSVRLMQRLAELDPAAAAKIEPGNTRRIVRALEVAAITGELFSSFAGDWDDYPVANVRVAGLDLPRDVLDARIRARVDDMLAAGFLDEVRGLVDRGFGEWLTASQAIGYAEMARYLAGEIDLDEAVAGTVRRTKTLARRQLAWFRRDPRIRWFPCEQGTDVVDAITEYLDG